jgi:hypothetical protein
MEAADRMADVDRKVSLLELAQRWLRLAEQMDTSRAHGHPGGDALLDGPSRERRSH